MKRIPNPDGPDVLEFDDVDDLTCYLDSDPERRSVTIVEELLHEAVVATDRKLAVNCQVYRRSGNPTSALAIARALGWRVG